MQIAPSLSSSAFSTHSSHASLGDFWTLMKPGVLSLVIFSGFVGMILAPQHQHPFLMAVSLLALCLGSGGAAVLNMWHDRSIDAFMVRTQHRPIPRGVIAPNDALSFGVLLCLTSMILMGLSANWKASGLLGLSVAYYAFFYTVYLKPRTSQNIVIGGAAGAFPPLIGWVSQGASLEFMPWWLFAMIFIWTPSHFWALALIKKDDYGKANIPMLPLTHGDSYTQKSIYGYAWLLFICSLIPWITGHLSSFYAVGAGVLGGIYLYLSHGVWRWGRPRDCGRLFGYSILYLFVIFAWVVGDHFYGG